MNKLVNINMRQWSERNFGVPHRPPNMPGQSMNPLQKISHGPGSGSATSLNQGPVLNNAPIFYSFNVPFASDLAGPNTEDILHATADAVLRWTHPEDAPDDVPVHQLPIHAQNLSNLDKLCNDISVSPLEIEARTITSVPKSGRNQVTTVCLVGAPELVYRTRESILNETPLSLVCSFLFALFYSLFCATLISLLTICSGVPLSISMARWSLTSQPERSRLLSPTPSTTSPRSAASTFSSWAPSLRLL